MGQLVIGHGMVTNDQMLDFSGPATFTENSCK